MDRRRAGRDILVCILCAHPTITIREHLLDRHGSKKNIPGKKIIISRGCLHSFQGLLYIVHTLEGYFVVTGATWDLCWDIRAQRRKLFFSRGRDKNPD